MRGKVSSYTAGNRSESHATRNVHWRKSTNEREGKPEQKQSLELEFVFSKKQAEMLYLFISSTSQAKI